MIILYHHHLVLVLVYTRARTYIYSYPCRYRTGTLILSISHDAWSAIRYGTRRRNHPACLLVCLLVMRVRICTRIYIYSIYPTVFLTYYKYSIITMQLNGYPAPTRPLPNAPDPLNEVCVVRSTLYFDISIFKNVRCRTGPSVFHQHQDHSLLPLMMMMMITPIQSWMTGPSLLYC